jgi:penicillin-binding protein 1C
LSKTKKILLTAAAILLIAYIFCLPKKLFDAPYSTVVTDQNGELLGARIAADEQWRFPPTDTIPDRLKTCLMTFEDRYFRWHWGVNPVSIARAAVQNVRNGRVISGGSTITMQVIRLSRKNQKRTLSEKFVEMILATRLEFRYSKAKIIALYASHAPFGGNVVGFQAAAWRYFGCDAKNLSWAQTAALAVLPNSPSMFNLSKNRDELLKKRNRLLTQLFENHKIDEIIYQTALAEPLPEKPQPLPQIAPHLVNYFFATQKGKNISSTINYAIQTQIEESAERWAAEFALSDIRNLAILVVDISNNQVVAYCGNVNYSEKKYGNQVDIIRANRSTGSVLKPFLYYAMLADGELLPDMLLPDIPMNIGGFIPQNFNMLFDGAVPASKAVSRSLNVPFVYLLKNYGIDKFYNFLKINHIADLPEPASHYGLPLILGGAESSLFNITNAYANFARSLLDLP